MRNIFSKRYISISICIAFSLLIQLSIPARVAAGRDDPITEPIYCGEEGTIDQCGAAGGCSEGSVCRYGMASPAFCTKDKSACPTNSPVSCGEPGTLDQCGAAGGCSEGKFCINSQCVGSGSRCPVYKPDVSTETDPSLNIFAGPNKSDFEDLNPLRIMDSAYEANFASPAGIINRVLLFAFPLAGLILFVMIVWGGFEMVSGATNSKSLQAGQQRITAALIGFGLLFVSFWIIQIVEYIFNIAVL